MLHHHIDDRGTTFCGCDDLSVDVVVGSGFFARASSHRGREALCVAEFSKDLDRLASVKATPDFLPCTDAGNSMSPGTPQQDDSVSLQRAWMSWRRDGEVCT